MASLFAKSSYKLYQFIVCPLCGNCIENKSKTIPCGHVFCQPCLQLDFEEFTKAKPGSRVAPPTEILCPTCCGFATMTDKFIQGFSDNISQQHPAVTMGINVKVVKDKAAKQRINQKCATGRECKGGGGGRLERYCSFCKLAYCAMCEKAHKKTHPGHVFIRKPNAWSMVCEQHRKPVDVLCDDCSVLLCATCLDAHQGHQCIPLPEKVEQCTAKVSETEETLKDIMKSKYNLLQQLEKLHEGYRVTREEMEKDIKREADRHIKVITDRRNILLRKTEQQFTFLNKAIKAHKEYVSYLLHRVDDFRNMTYSLRERGNEPKLLANYENIRVHSVNIDHSCKQKVDRLKDILRLYKFSSSDNMSVGTLEETTIELPELAAEELDRPPIGWAPLDAPLIKPKKRPVIRVGAQPDGRSVQPQGVTFLPDGHLVITEYNGRQLCIINPDTDPDGKAPIHVTYPNNHLFPRNVVVIDDNNTVAVTDDYDKCVKIFAYGKEPSMLKPKTGIFVAPSGLAFVPRKKYFVVSDVGQHNIVIMNMQGTVKGEIPKKDPKERAKVGNNGAQGPYRFNGPDFLTVDMRERILVSDSKNQLIKVFELDGRFLFEFGKDGATPLGCPMGICCNRQNNILVSDGQNHRVCEFNEDGEFMRDILTQPEHEIVWPWGLAISPSGVVAISDSSDSVIRLFDVYHYIDSESDDDDSD